MTENLEYKRGIQRSMKTIVSHMDKNEYTCPMPQKWQHVYSLLPDTKRAGAGFDPPAPLILGAWYHTSQQEKRQRFLIILNMQ